MSLEARSFAFYNAIMRYAFYLGLPLLFIFTIVTARSEDSVMSLIESHLWQDRVLVIMAQDITDPAYQKQLSLLRDAQGVAERNIAIYDVVEHVYVKQNGRILPHVPATRFMAHFEAVARQPFTVLLLGKDGEQKLVQHQPITLDLLFSTIDAMPMRKDEMRAAP